MEQNPYNVILDNLPSNDSRLEILFRQAGDGFIQVEYGREQRAHLKDSFRIQTVNDIILKKNLNGLIETLPGIRTNMFHYDPEVLSVNKLIEEIKDAEESVESIEDLVIESRLIHLPIAFKDSETQKACEKYVKEVRPDAPNVINGCNLDYIAMCNGITVEEVKKIVLGTEFYNSGGGFWPGGGFFWPMDPRCAIVVPKCNPPRTWTPEGAVGLGGPCVFTYTTPAGGGYQVFGRTIPIFQFSQKHPLFKDSPFLYRPTDRIKFHEVSEEEIIDIHKRVHEKADYEYQIEQGQIVVKKFLEFLNTEEVQKGVKELKEKQKEGNKKAPKL